MSSDLIPELIKGFINELPFNQHVGLEVIRDASGELEVHFENQKCITGNPVLNILHGGMIASAIDLAGGCTALAAILTRMEKNGTDMAAFDPKLLARSCTVDLRIDYLRPGRGKHFRCSGKIRSMGSQLVFVVIELHNEQGTLIATGTGTYLVNIANKK